LEQIFEVLNDFRVAAAEFKAKHRRHAVLVIDNINVLADEAPWLLKDLQGLAKEVADCCLAASDYERGYNIPHGHTWIEACGRGRNNPEVRTTDTDIARCLRVPRRERSGDGQRFVVASFLIVLPLIQLNADFFLRAKAEVEDKFDDSLVESHKPNLASSCRDPRWRLNVCVTSSLGEGKSLSLFLKIRSHPGWKIHSMLNG
jgi:hypothetical protein